MPQPGQDPEEALRTAVEALCKGNPTDRLKAIAKLQQLLALSGFLAEKMAWMHNPSLADLALTDMTQIEPNTRSQASGRSPWSLASNSNLNLHLSPST